MVALFCVVLLASWRFHSLPAAETEENPRATWPPAAIDSKARSSIKQEAITRLNQHQSSDPCHGYDRILHISQGDVEGAAGTIFFLFVLNQVLYAEKFNLLPWVHLNNVSHYVYDPKVHAIEPSFTWEATIGPQPSWRTLADLKTQQKVQFPGPLVAKQNPFQKNITIIGNGVWESYFQPLSEFSPRLHLSASKPTSCSNLPIVKLLPAHILPGLHLHCPWALRAWRYGGVPPILAQSDRSYQDWFAPMRKQGSRLVQRYVHPQPWLMDRVHSVDPISSSKGQNENYEEPKGGEVEECLALHIRHSDKANRRRRIPVKRFVPYIAAYAEERERWFSKHSQDRPKDISTVVYVATDSGLVLEKLQRAMVAEAQVNTKFTYTIQWRWQTDILRSNDTTPVFQMATSNDQSLQHRTNTEVLVDILAMAQCQWLLHGFSAVTEATHYFNPDLHTNRSVNLDVPLNEQPSVEVFREWVQDALS